MVSTTGPGWRKRARGDRVELEDLPEEIRQAFPRPVATRGTVRPLDEVEKLADWVDGRLPKAYEWRAKAVATKA